MLCAWLTWAGVLIVAVMPSSVLCAASGSGVQSSQTAYNIEEEYVKLARERPTFAVYALINNVACERCRMNASFLDKAKKCLPRSVNLKTKTCITEEQYLLEYGDNAMGIVSCYVKRLHMTLEKLYCLLRANELMENPGLDVASTATRSSTRGPLIRWPRRKPYRQVLAAGNASEYGDKEVRPYNVEPAAGEYELHPDGHRPYRRPDPDYEGTRGDSAPPEEKDYDDEIARWREDYWKKRRYIYNEDNDGDMVDSAGGQHQESNRPPRWQQRRRKNEDSPDLGDSNGSSDERQKSRPYRRHGAAGNSWDNGHGRAPQGGYDVVEDALEKRNGRGAGGSQRGYDADQGETVDNSGRKRAREPLGGYEDGYESVPVNGRRIRTKGPQEGYEAEQDDALYKRHGRRTGGPQKGYDADRREALDNSSRKRTRGPPGDYEDDQEGLPDNGRRVRTRGPQEGFEPDREGNVGNSRGEGARGANGHYDDDKRALGGSHGKRTREPQGLYKADEEEGPGSSRKRKTRGPQRDYDADREDGPENSYENRRGPQEYDADQDGVPANGRTKMTKGRQGGYGADQRRTMSTGPRRTSVPRESYEADQDPSHDWSAGIEDDETPSYISGVGRERNSVKSFEHDTEESFSTVDTDLSRRSKMERRGGRGRTDEELGNKPRGGWSRRLEGNEASTEGVSDKVPLYKRTRRRRKNQNEQGDTLLDTIRVRDARKSQTTPSGFEDFIRFDDDDEGPSEASSADGDQRNENGNIREDSKARTKRQDDKHNSPGLNIP